MESETIRHLRAVTLTTDRGEQRRMWQDMQDRLVQSLDLARQAVRQSN